MTKLTPAQKQAIVQEQEAIVKNAWRAYQNQPDGTDAQRKQKKKLGERYVRESGKAAKYHVGIGFPE